MNSKETNLSYKKTNLFGWLSALLLVVTTIGAIFFYDTKQYDSKAGSLLTSNKSDRPVLAVPEKAKTTITAAMRTCSPFESGTTGCEPYKEPPKVDARVPSAEEVKAAEASVAVLHSKFKQFVADELAAAFSGDAEAIKDMKNMINECAARGTVSPDYDAVCAELKSRQAEIDAMSPKKG